MSEQPKGADEVDDEVDDVEAPKRSRGYDTQNERSGATREFHPNYALGDPFPEPSEPVLSPSGISEGSSFGAYRVGPCIGQGGMARIYRAEHTGLRRQVALKVLVSGVSKDPEGRERFLREARIAAAIKHPNVVNIFDVGVCEGIPYLVMELLEGQDLESLVEGKGPLDEGTIIDLVVPVVAGLVAVHDSGVVHRDLKPGNIFLARGRNDEVEPKLLDFGISKSLGNDQLQLTSANGQIMGTPFYMPPEAVRGMPMSHLSDQYALGVVLYECATGRNPFHGSAFPEVISLITNGKYSPLSQASPHLSKRFVSIVERAMALEPSERFDDLRGLGRELLLLAGQRTRITWGLTFGEGGSVKPSVAAMTIGRSPTPKRSTTRSTRPVGRRLWWLGAAALLLGGALFVALAPGPSWRRGALHAAPNPPQPRGEPVVRELTLSPSPLAEPAVRDTEREGLAALKLAELQASREAAERRSSQKTPAKSKRRSRRARRRATRRRSAPTTPRGGTTSEPKPQEPAWALAVTAPALPSPQIPDEAPPWAEGSLVGGNEVSGQEGGGNVGSNGSPIFD